MPYGERRNARVGPLNVIVYFRSLKNKADWRNRTSRVRSWPISGKPERKVRRSINSPDWSDFLRAVRGLLFPQRDNNLARGTSLRTVKLQEDYLYRGTARVILTDRPGEQIATMFTIACVSYFSYQVRRADTERLWIVALWLHRAFRSPVSAPLGYLPSRRAGDRVSCRGNINVKCCGDSGAEDRSLRVLSGPCD